MPEPVRSGQEPQKPQNPNPAGDTPPDPKGEPGKAPPGQDPEGQSAKKPDPDPTPGELGFTDLAAANTEIKNLRKENAKARTSNKDLKSEVTTLGGRFSKLESGLKSLFGEGDDKLTPEERVEKLTQQNQVLEVETALRDAAWEHGVGKDEYDYFSFLVSKGMDGLKDDEEMSTETLAEIAVKAKGKTANPSTSVGGNGKGPEGGDPPPANAQDPDLPTPDEFAAMGIGEQSLLYQQLKAKGRDAEYDKLWKASEAKRRELKRKKRLF